MCCWICSPAAWCPGQFSAWSIDGVRVVWSSGQRARRLLRSTRPSRHHNRHHSQYVVFFCCLLDLCWPVVWKSWISHQIQTAICRQNWRKFRKMRKKVRYWWERQKLMDSLAVSVSDGVYILGLFLSVNEFGSGWSFGWVSGFCWISDSIVYFLQLYIRNEWWKENKLYVGKKTRCLSSSTAVCDVCAWCEHCVSC